MTNPFTRHVWTGQVVLLHNALENRHEEFTITGLVGEPFTLLRTLVWVHFAGYSFYNIGNTGERNQPCGYALGALNGTAYNGNPPTDDPANEWVDLVATGSTVLNYAALGWPPDSTAHLSGSVNEIDSSATLATIENLNTFMYGNATIFEDSHAQRTFVEDPQFSFFYTPFLGGLTLSTDVDVWAQIRMLWQQRS